MEELGDDKTADEMQSGQAAGSRPEQELENHEAETGEGDQENQVEIPERKPVETILFVDDEEPIRKLFKEALEKSGYKVTVASNGNEGLALFREHPADLVITDIFMPEKDGHHFILDIIQEFPGTKIFAITGKRTVLGMDTELDVAKLLGAMKGFVKPVKFSELLDSIKSC